MLSLEIIKFCAEECETQSSGEISVYHMCNAYEYALFSINNHSRGERVDYYELVKILGWLIEPTINKNGFRHSPVLIRYIPVNNLTHEQIDQQVKLLINAFYEKNVGAQEFYRLFQEIHPFEDGNGRVGAIIFNVLNNTLTSPTKPEFERK